MKTISTSVKFSRINIELLYSFILLIFIPGAMILNTVITSYSIKKNIQNELQNRASIASQIFSIVASDNLHNEQTLQDSIDTLMTKEDEIKAIEITKPSNMDFTIVASSNLSTVGTLVEDNLTQYRLALDKGQPVAMEYPKGNDSSGRTWSVISPVVDKGGNIAALANIEVSSILIDQAVNSTLNKSFIILIVTVIIVVLLLVNHFRFAQYATLTKKIQEADRLKTDFLSVATHELKAPMSTIKGYTSNVLDGTFGEINDKIRENLNEAIRQTDRLNNLVQDLLNVSRLEQGRINFDIKPVNVAEIIEPIVKNYQKQAISKGLSVFYQAPEQSIFIMADAGRYQEIMTNLIDNAIKYSIQGRVEVKHVVEKDMVKTLVRDSGIGMSAKERENLFSRFYRIKNEDTQNIGGTGLGLWIIKQYIEKMGGKIYVDSMKGVGSEFTVELPKTQAKTE